MMYYRKQMLRYILHVYSLTRNIETNGMSTEYFYCAKFQNSHHLFILDFLSPKYLLINVCIASYVFCL